MHNSQARVITLLDGAVGMRCRSVVEVAIIMYLVPASPAEEAMRGDISHALLDSQLLLVVAGISGSYIYRTFFSTRGLGTGKHILLNQQCSRQSGLATGWQYVTAHYCCPLLGHSPCGSAPAV